MLSAADVLATSPLVRWTWTGPANDDQIAALSEFRPTDRETVLEMMQGRFLLASKLVDTCRPLPGCGISATGAAAPSAVSPVG